MKKWMIRALSALLIAAFLPVSVLADEYDLTQGSVTVSTSKGADGSTQQDVSHKGTTKPDSNPIITSKGQPTDKTITIKADDGTTANVTITASARLGGVSWPDDGAGLDEFVAGNGAGRLDLNAFVGRISVRRDDGSATSPDAGATRDSGAGKQWWEVWKD